MVLLLVMNAACSTKPTELGSSEGISKIVEGEMDPETEHDVKMLLDAYPDGDYEMQHVIYAAESLRDQGGIGPFVSIQRLDDKEFSSYDKALSIAFMLEIVDDTGTHFWVSFAGSGLAVTVYPPDYKSTTDLAVIDSVIDIYPPPVP